ncbi:MAG TPA: Na+/H+ antiporter NhaA [Propionibacteriaceae bacterium]|nr:Na+/H+ antiporter NhaA [Propionibacteriaceae bacterium]
MSASLPRRLFRPAEGHDDFQLRDVLRQETFGGFLMLAATVVALVWANVATDSYYNLTHLQLGPLTAHEWAADGLLTLFFFVAGLELKRELVEGSLSRPADALVPIVAALAGMVAPALIYLSLNLGDKGDPAGWAVPMATDIAFALAVLAIVGSSLPVALRAFLLTLAIVDDLGAIIVIAIFFSDGINAVWLLGSVACMALWWLGMRRRIETPILYVLLFIAAWVCMLQSGVHATIAGVALGLLTRTAEDETHDPVDRWRHAVEPWSAGLAVPIFALMAAGVPVGGDALAGLIDSPVALGIIAGLLIGKTGGIFLGAWLTARFTSAELGGDIRWADVAATALLSGIGFTVALLICDLAFADPAVVEQAKAAVLVASLTAAVLGGILLRLRNRRHIVLAEEADV